jgi:hypothetical protein
MIYVVPLEIFEERYTEQWSRWFATFLDNAKIDHTFIKGKELVKGIEQGSFLDIVGTNYFKASQLMQLCKFIKKGIIRDKDTIFFFDLWYPGIEMLAYMRDALKIDFKIAGILHAGSYDEHDMLHRVGMTQWAHWFERGWLEFVDHIFVATQFHKELILNKRTDIEANDSPIDNHYWIEEKIHITGLPIYPEFANSNPWSRQDILFPHRLDPEKNPHMFDELEKACRESDVDFSKWNFFKTKDMIKNKQEYYNMLNNGSIAVSFAEQETWGIAMQEAVMCGCIPLVPNRLSYQELYPAEFRFHSFGQCVNMIVKMVTDEQYFEAMQVMAQILAQKFIMKGKFAIEKMLTILEEV